VRSSVQYIRVVEFITPLPEPDEVKAILDDGVEVPGEEQVRERLVPFEHEDNIVLVKTHDLASLVELHMPEDGDFAVSYISGWDDKRRIDFSGAFRSAVVAHPPKVLLLGVRQLTREMNDDDVVIPHQPREER